MQQREEPVFMTDTSFQLAIEQMVAEGMNYLDAIIEFSETHDIEFDVISKLMTSNLKDKLKLVAMEEGYMRQESTLPI